MRRNHIYLFLIVLVVVLLVAGVYFRLSSRADPGPTPVSGELECCQCTALGQDQYHPYPKVPGYTCEEYCFQGCLERGYSETACKIGQVGGYAMVCPDVIQPTATPFGE
jgi:hypothetical protein